MTQETGSRTSQDQKFYSEEMEKDRRYEEVYSKYCDGIDVSRYARGRENLNEIGRALPEWDILPPEQPK